MSSVTKHIPKYSVLKIKDVVLNVKLGCLAEERSVPQAVHLSAVFRFSKVPSGALSDSLDETICYAQVCQILTEHCETREFKLIERIGLECFSLIREFVKDRNIEIGIKVHKIRPPVENLSGGSHFECGDFYP